MDTGNRGFTLIELLVIVAIIGILLGVVAVFVSGAKSRSKDASVKQNLVHLRNRVELLYGDATPPPYGNTCDPNLPGCTPWTKSAGCSGNYLGASVFGDSVVLAYLQALRALSNEEAQCNARGNTWAVAASLPGVPGSLWCVDSSGSAKLVAGSLPINNGLCT